MKNGIGSPASIVRAQAKLYLRWKADPQVAECDILRELFVSRARIAGATGCGEMSYKMAGDESWVESVVNSNLDLLCTTVFIVCCEHPELRNGSLPDALQESTFRTAVRTVASELDKRAPIWRQHYSDVLDKDTGEHHPERFASQGITRGPLRLPS